MRSTVLSRSQTAYCRRDIIGGGELIGTWLWLRPRLYTVDVALETDGLCSPAASSCGAVGIINSLAHFYIAAKP
jgi:hypothetical protein